jgi:hypothetical protein
MFSDLDDIDPTPDDYTPDWIAAEARRIRRARLIGYAEAALGGVLVGLIVMLGLIILGMWR